MEILFCALGLLHTSCGVFQILGPHKAAWGMLFNSEGGDPIRARPPPPPAFGHTALPKVAGLGPRMAIGSRGTGREILSMASTHCTSITCCRDNRMYALPCLLLRVVELDMVQIFVMHKLMSMRLSHTSLSKKLNGGGRLQALQVRMLGSKTWQK